MKGWSERFSAWQVGVEIAIAELNYQTNPKPASTHRGGESGGSANDLGCH